MPLGKCCCTEVTEHRAQAFLHNQDDGQLSGTQWLQQFMVYRILGVPVGVRYDVLVHMLSLSYTHSEGSSMLWAFARS